MLIARDGWHKPGMVVNYSQTVNQYILLDAYTLPNINEQISEIAKWTVFSNLYLKSLTKTLLRHFKNLPFITEDVKKDL